MDTFQILVSTDFSEFATAALRAAVSIASSRQPAEITLLHVDTGIMPIYDEELGVLEPTRLLHLLRMKTLERTANAPCPIPIREVVTYGEPVEKIIEQAATDATDLIVMGSHGRKGFDRLLVGSVAEGVLRRATCPVLCVKQPRSTDGPNGSETTKSEQVH